MSSLRVAVVGAGLSGLVCARDLRQAGHEVQIFDKGRGVSGRMSTRRVIEPELQFDHGAQYFTARDAEFRQQVDDWIARGVVAIWEGPFGTLTRGEIGPAPTKDPRYVGTPGMNAICRALADGLVVKCSSRVTQLDRQNGKWSVQVEDLAVGTGGAETRAEGFDHVVIAIPPAQAADLLPKQTSLQDIVREATMAPCIGVMVAFQSQVDLDLNGVFVQDSLIRWMARDSSRPGRNSGTERWILHATPEWSREHIDETPDQIIPTMLHAFAEAVGKDVPGTIYEAAHRWLYAIPENPFSRGALNDEQLKLTICGDWCHDARVEGAFLSGRAAARAILS
ncbi:NAD(P)/FAD-dependent oxidoreductase [Rubinisphaera margarita]|uniref:NAD(P)/FAD-dependent oxidoreductase n=1 Tax=Rubinisphaera margarita TaxID=2909586 RepID=UPI001EE92043|nr:FAD-dependent oxidoreductase [Rubinisphaera margarita]MCG6158592.1 FAD-dependent oxidoreductase [Rubinisphaera margarita]